MQRVVQWISLPIAMFCLGAPLWSLMTDYKQYAGKSLTQAQVLSVRISSGRSRGSPGLYDAEVRYRVGNHFDERRLDVSTYKFLKPGDTVGIFVDQKTGDASDDLRLESWEMAGWGMLAAIFFVAAFRVSGKLLREGRARL